MGETDELVAHVRQLTGARPYESDILLQAVELGRDPLTAARAWLKDDPDESDPMTLAESPCVLLGETAAAAAAEIERRRARWGFTSMTTFAPSSDALCESRRLIAERDNRAEPVWCRVPAETCGVTGACRQHGGLS